MYAFLGVVVLTRTLSCVGFELGVVKDWLCWNTVLTERSIHFCAGGGASCQFRGHHSEVPTVSDIYQCVCDVYRWGTSVALQCVLSTERRWVAGLYGSVSFQRRVDRRSRIFRYDLLVE